MKIIRIHAYEVLDSRGFPTVAAIVQTDTGAVGKAMVPSGASTGDREAVELRDNDPKRFNGKGVLKAVQNVNEIIAPALIGFNVTEQRKIDEMMITLDNTPNKSKLGANAILAVSLAVAKAASYELHLPLYRYIREHLLANTDNKYLLPVPMLNILNGGVHASNTLDFQEFLIMPIGAKSIHEAIRMSSEIFHALAKILKEKNQTTLKGDEGGYAPEITTFEETLDLMVLAVKKAGYNPSTVGNHGDVAFAMDLAASELYGEDKKYHQFKAIAAKKLSNEQGTMTTTQLKDKLIALTKKYPIISIEDPFAEHDTTGFEQITKEIGSTVQIVGDDYYCTNPAIIKVGIGQKATNSVLIKLNQIGTLSETIEAVLLAKQVNWTAVVSHRSGETEDTFIADLVVGLGTGQIKTGSMSRSERIAKYNRLLEIENELGTSGSYLGREVFYNIKK